MVEMNSESPRSPRYEVGFEALEKVLELDSGGRE